MKKSLPTFAILVSLLFHSNAFSAMYSYENLFERDSDYITNITTVGNWKYKDQEGRFRVIYVEYMLGCSWLYIQWMNGFDSHAGIDVVKTLPIYENDHHENTFDQPIIKKNQNGLSIEYTALNGHDFERYKVEIQIFNEPGKHTLNKKRL